MAKATLTHNSVQGNTFFVNSVQGALILIYACFFIAGTLSPNKLVTRNTLYKVTHTYK